MADDIDDIDDIDDREETHTPGPWIYWRDGDYWGIGSIVEGKDNGDGNEADYRLMAAAPDLLAALENLLDDFNINRFNEARAAIRKARGQ